jgi:hypothetical protein
MNTLWRGKGSQLISFSIVENENVKHNANKVMLVHCASVASVQFTIITDLLVTDLLITDLLITDLLITDLCWHL